MKFGIVPVMVVAVFGIVAGMAAAEDGLKLAVADKEPPAELSEDIRGQLAPKSYSIASADGTVYEFWFVPSLKSKVAGATAKETLLGVEEISLLGALVVSDTEPHDFRDDPLDKGLYVLRVALQPEDGNHLGTAPFDTFAILMPNDKDHLLKDGYNHDNMVELAQEGTIAEHPPILSLQPIEKEKAEGEFPRIEVNAEHEWEFLYIKFPIDAAGTKTELTVGLVVQGIGEL